MAVEFDAGKKAANIAKHGLSFASVESFDFDTAYIVQDARRDYREVRYQAIGELDGLVVLLVFTMRGTGTVRPISLRPASRKERKLWQSEM